MNIKKTLCIIPSLLLMIFLCYSFTTAQAAVSKTSQDSVDWALAQKGQSIDVDGAYGAQCVDLIMSYYKNFWGVSSAGGNGKDYAINKLPGGWSRIAYYPGFAAQPGDIAVFEQTPSSSGKSYGHVTIVISADQTGFNAIGQSGGITKEEYFKYTKDGFVFWGVIRPPFTDSEAKITIATSSVLVNNNPIPFPACTIYGNNYFKLRDLAMVLNGTAKQFAIGYDKATNTITLTTGQPYTPVGGELSGAGSTNVLVAVPAQSTINLNGQKIDLMAYTISGSNYFRLRDIGKSINFGVIWDGNTNKIKIDTTTGYSDSTLSDTAGPIISIKSITNLTAINAQINADVTTNGMTVTQIGFYIGASPDNLGTKKTENFNYSKNFPMWYDMNKWYGALSAATTYYYQFFVIANGQETLSDINSFTTNALPPVASPTITAKPVTNLSSTNAQINADVTTNGTSVTQIGFFIGTSPNNLGTKKTENFSYSKNFPMWYDMNKWFGTLSAGTTYYYQFFVVTNGQETRSDINSFTTIAPPTTAAPIITVKPVTNLSATNAQINAYITVNGTTITQIGFYFGTTPDNLTKKMENFSYAKNFSMWYDMNKWYGTLTPGTTYYYRFFVIANGQERIGDINSFTTKF